jgi:hypothetical protein
MSPEHSNIASRFETVHTVIGYYDGPRSGIADYHGRPHIYESLFQDAPDGTDVFLLQPVDDETFRLAMEDWAIWCRWERAFHGRETSQDTHPALPADRVRHEELEQLLSTRLRIEPDRAFRVTGRFVARAPATPGLTSSTEWIVYWMSRHDAG